LQLCHWYWKVIVADPLHVPGLAVSVLPAVVVPVIVGGELLPGATVARDDAATATPTAMSAPTSARTSTRSRLALGRARKRDVPVMPQPPH
jgi:hypothetical protein